jgi:hypothetical protein
MLIKQNQLLGEATALLDSIEYLSLDESTIDPTMVNVRHNVRLGQDLIQLESFLGFAQCYGIEDAGLAIHRVCEANDVPRTNLGFVANEENIIADDELADTFSQLSEAGFPCHIARISSDSTYYSALMEALELDQGYATFEESINLQNYVNESVLTDAKDKVAKGYETARDKIKQGAEYVGDKVSSGYNAAKSKISSGYNMAKNKVSGAVGVVSKKLASVRKAISEKMAKAKNAPASAKAMIMRQVDKLKSAAKDLKNKLYDLKGQASKKVSNVADSVASKARGVKASISSGVNNITKRFSKEG